MLIAKIPSIQYPEFGNLKYPQGIMTCKSGHTCLEKIISMPIYSARSTLCKKERNPSRLFFWSCGWMRSIQNPISSDSRPNNQESLGVSSTAKSRNGRSSIAHKKKCQLGMSVNPWLSKLRSHIFSWMAW